MIQFDHWFQEASNHPLIDQPNAMCISTIDREGFPDSRFVLLKDHDNTSLVFYTNYESNKGRQLLATRKIAVNFYWQPLKHQVRMKGTVEPVDSTTADTYFATRSRGSQLGSWASQQSRPLASREELEFALAKYTEKFKDKEIPRPSHWSGFRILPFRIEFWESGSNRLHDRFVYSKQVNNSWIIERLYP